MTTETKAAQTGDWQEDWDDMLDKRFAAYSGRGLDEDALWWMGTAQIAVSDPIAADLYLSHVSMTGHKFREIKDWGYRVAVEFVGARGSGERKRSLVESYRVDWGHQAARDGIAIALWGSEEVPGITARVVQFHCGAQAYQRVRNAVESRTRDAVARFRHGLRWAKGDVRDRDLEESWEAATGGSWACG